MLTLKKCKVGTKIAMGFGGAIGIILIISTVCYLGLLQIDELSHEVGQDNDHNAFVLIKEIEHLKWMAELSSLFLLNEVDSIQVQTNDHKCAFGKMLYGEAGREMASEDSELAAFLEEVKGPHQRLHESAIAIGDTYVAFDVSIDSLLAERWIDHLVWLKDLSNSLLSNTKFTGGLDPQQCAFGRWYHSYQTDDTELQALLSGWEEPHMRLHQSAQDIVAAMNNNDMLSALAIYQNKTLPELNHLSTLYKQTMIWVDNKVKLQQKALDIFQVETGVALNGVEEVLEKMRSHIGQKSQTATLLLTNRIDSNLTLIAIVSLVAVFLGIGSALVVRREVNISLGQAIGELGDSADEIATVSHQVSICSRELAEGASEQAASIEEISASLEEISSMTRQNADNAGQAKDKAKEARKVIGLVDQHMNHMAAAIEEITKLSEETRKINKTIDEIAFQTNLLALNAAVEAARAGEAGAGFAVVAEEVRNLALRSTSAAKNTSGLIEEIIQSVRAGNELTASTREAFGQNIEISEVIGTLVGEIAAASEEQARGIDQLNEAVRDIDKVTQQTAANADQSASAAMLLSQRDEQLRSSVDRLQCMVQGTGKDNLLKQEVELDYPVAVENDNLSLVVKT
ncbi:MAG: CZB domain-containing protein [Desulfobulbaceae bacterium]|nr:CZB domain-containing protein [Desulfobulbaceae bacterium]